MGVSNFLWSIALKKGGRAIIKVVIALFTAEKTMAALSALGITIDMAAFEAGLTAAVYAFLEIVQNWLKHKQGVKGL